MLSLLIGLLLVACSSASSVPAATAVTGARTVPDREVVIAVSRDLANGPQDPWFCHSSCNVWEPLVGLDEGLQPRPVLAERWELSEDGRTWTFTLRSGVRFSDGTPFDADVVVKNLERMIKISPRPSPYTALDINVGYGGIPKVTRLDATTVAFESEKPNPTMVSTMSNFFSAMYSPASFAENGDFTGPPVATGPFKIVEWQAGQFLRLERNENYWGEKAKIRQLRLRTILDANARVSALQAGEIDGVAELGALFPAQAAQLQGRPGLTVGADPISRSQYLAFNSGRAPFNDVRLRRAVLLALDRKALVDSVVFGYALPGDSLIAPYSKAWYSPRGSVRPDLVEARRLAQEALGGRTVEAVLPFNTSPGQAIPYKETAEYLQALLRPLGIELRLQGMENAALTDAINRGEYDLRFTSLGWVNGDPDFIFNTFMRSTAPFNTTAKGGYNNPEVDRLIAEGKVERDPRKRYAIYERLQEIAAQEAPVIVLYYERQPYAYRDTISGLRHRINFQPTFDQIVLLK
jgi:peptide/nickel transport system substrate-binding protein